MSLEENKTRARRWVGEVWDKGSLAAVDEFLSADFSFNYADPGVTSDREGYKETVTTYHSFSPDMRYTVDEVLAEGDKVTVRWTGRGTHKGDLMGIAPTGNQITITGISIVRIAGGRIAEEHTEMDMFGVMQQIGALPT